MGVYLYSTISTCCHLTRPQSYTYYQEQVYFRLSFIKGSMLNKKSRKDRETKSHLSSNLDQLNSELEPQLD